MIVFVFVPSINIVFLIKIQIIHLSLFFEYCQPDLRTGTTFVLELVHSLKNLTFQFTPVTHMVYLKIRLHYLDFAIENLTSSNWISKYTMCVTGVNWKVKFLSACIISSGLKILNRLTFDSHLLLLIQTTTSK